ncbi:MAG: DUF433 domain-containing protein [Bacteroidota bacterium]
MDYSLHIYIDSNIRFGKPCVKNTRISVYDVLGWLASGMSISEIIADYTELNEENIYACLAYVADKENQLKIV